MQLIRYIFLGIIHWQIKCCPGVESFNDKPRSFNLPIWEAFCNSCPEIRSRGLVALQILANKILELLNAPENLLLSWQFYSGGEMKKVNHKEL